MKTRLLIVDDHELIRDGIRELLHGSDVVVVAEAANGHEALEKLGQHEVDVALVDIRMPGCDGFDFLTRLRNRDGAAPRVLMHSVEGGWKAVQRCAELGAHGLIPKGQEKNELIRAIQRVQAGSEVWGEYSRALSRGE